MPSTDVQQGPYHAAITDFFRLHDPSTDARELPAIRQRMKRRLSKATRALNRKYATRTPRRRGAGRPRAQAARSSAKSGDSGDPDPGESDPAALLNLALPAIPCGCPNPLIETWSTEYGRIEHCVHCGHDMAGAS